MQGEEWEHNRRKAVVGREEERDKCRGESGNNRRKATVRVYSKWGVESLLILTVDLRIKSNRFIYRQVHIYILAKSYQKNRQQFISVLCLIITFIFFFSFFFRIFLRFGVNGIFGTVWFKNS